jgi:hypothetical protein
MKTYIFKPLTFLTVGILSLAFSCDKKNPEPNPNPTYNIPSTYNFEDANGNSTVDYSGQTDRLNQLREMVAYMKTGTTSSISAQQLKDMFANTNDNGNGHFTFTASGKQLKNKCFSLDVELFEKYMDSIEIASIDFAQVASNGQSGTLSSGTSTYLFTKTGMEPLHFIEKGLMGAVFMHQALNVYFGDDKMSADNSTVVNGKYYTALEHYWDEAFGYFGVGIDFPSTIPNDFWGKYSNNQNSLLSSNNTLMTNFIKGRAAVTAKVPNDYKTAITNIQNMWEDVSANQAIKYLNDAVSSFGSDDAKFLHVLSEAYAFTWCLRYVPTEVRNVTQTELTAIMDLFGDNLWELTISDINAIKTALEAKY